MIYKKNHCCIWTGANEFVNIYAFILNLTYLNFHVMLLNKIVCYISCYVNDAQNEAISYYALINQTLRYTYNQHRVRKPGPVRSVHRVHLYVRLGVCAGLRPQGHRVQRVRLWRVWGRRTRPLRPGLPRVAFGAELHRSTAIHVAWWCTWTAIQVSRGAHQWSQENLGADAS